MAQIPVLFRAERSGDFKGEVTAVFPTLEANRGMMVIYAHFGQHSEGCEEWYRATRAARSDEYADLLTELRRIYERDGDTLQLMQRRSA